MASRPLTSVQLNIGSAAFWRQRWPAVLFATILPIGIYARIVTGWSMPLWFDETFSGTIASQPRIADLLFWCRHELTGPGFYAPLWVWAQIAGTSDIALRLPSLCCAIATPLILAQFGDSDGRLRLIWATCTLLWTPALTTATEARPYAQLFLLGILQAIAFLHAMRRPTVSRAVTWSLVTALMALTHYHALAIGLCQGLAWLAFHRHRARACWPALAAFSPLAGWMTIHLPFVLAYQQSGLAYATLADLLLPSIPPDLRLLLSGGIAIVIGGVAGCAIRFGGGARSWIMTPERALAGSGIAALAIELGLGFLHSGFAPRYLTPSIPAMLYGVALWVRRVERTDGLLVAAVFAIMGAPFVMTLHAALARPVLDDRHAFNFEYASAWLAERSPQRLAFFWSDDAGRRSGDRTIAGVAGFFLHRAGLATTVIVLHPVRDPGASLRAAAGVDGHGAILLIGSDGNVRTRNISHIIREDPRWECRDFGDERTLILACRDRR